MANESRVLDIFGPNFLIESNGEAVGIGAFAYQMYATTKLLLVVILLNINKFYMIVVYQRLTQKGH